MANNRNKKINGFSGQFKALSNPHRLKIFMRLVKCCGPNAACSTKSDQMKACVGQLGKDLGIVASTVSHHIKELHQAGLISMERRGQKINCWVDPETVRGLARFFVELKPIKKRRRKK